MFRDEGERILRKVLKTKDAKRMEKKSMAKSEKDLDATENVEEIVLPMSPSTNFDDLPVCLFLKNYTITASDFSRGYLDNVSSLYGRTHHQGVLSVTISAVGLALMSNINRAPEVMVVAREKFVKALRMTNTALLDPLESKADSTLMAVTLLGMFEVSPPTSFSRNQV
jgi:hypothetical protein